MATVPKDAATVIIVRNSNGLEGECMQVLMVLRHPKSDFIPGSYVFPGGALEDGDYCTGMECVCAGLDCGRAAHIFGDVTSPERALGLWIAAIRETFEESGLLLAYRHDDSLVSLETSDEVEQFRRYRQMLAGGEMSFRELLEREKLTLATDRLHYYAHWITPELSPIRYDTRFFVCEAPAAQTALHDGIELTKHRWIDPLKALEDYHKGRIRMVIPTVVILEELSRFSNTGDLIRSTEGKSIPAILVRIVIDEANTIIAYTPDGREFRGIPAAVP